MARRTSCRTESLKNSSWVGVAARAGPVDNSSAMQRQNANRYAIRSLEVELEEEDDRDEPAAAGGRRAAGRIGDRFQHYVAYQLHVVIHVPIDANRRRVVGVGLNDRSGRVRRHWVGQRSHVEPELLGPHGKLDGAKSASGQFASRLEPAVLAFAGQRPRPGEVPGSRADAGKISAVKSHPAPLLRQRDELG